MLSSVSIFDFDLFLGCSSLGYCKTAILPIWHMAAMLELCRHSQSSNINTPWESRVGAPDGETNRPSVAPVRQHYKEGIVSHCYK